MIARHIGLLCLAAWVGMSAFFSFVLAPAAFRVLQRDQAGKLVGEIFPIYYHVGLVLGLTALACWWVEHSRVPHMPHAGTRLALLVTMNVLLLISAYILLPFIHDLKAQLAVAESPQLKTRFGFAHGISVALNLATLLAALATFLLAV